MTQKTSAIEGITLRQERKLLEVIAPSLACHLLYDVLDASLRDDYHTEDTHWGYSLWFHDLERRSIDLSWPPPFRYLDTKGRPAHIVEDWEQQWTLIISALEAARADGFDGIAFLAASND